MGFGAALRSLYRPLSRTLVSHTAVTSFAATSSSSANHLKPHQLNSTHSLLPWFGPMFNHFHSLTDTRFPKRRPMDKPRRKRSSVRPPGPYAGVQYVPGEPVGPSRPNEGSVKRRNEKKRIAQRHAFILSEKKKRKALVQEAKRKKSIKRIENKMAAVARDRAWAVRLAELQQLEEEKKKSMA